MDHVATSILDSADLPCPLCKSSATSEYGRDERRRYIQCSVCSLVFVPSLYFLDENAEKARYDLHRNFSGDPQYRRFLDRLSVPVQETLAPGSTGLDFGCGPEPELARIFVEKGHKMTVFDPFYAKDQAALNRQYDFITASEVAEHLREPQKDLKRLWTCLKPGGTLGIMTRWLGDPGAFSRWHYKNDTTHICFFSPESLTWIAVQWDAELTFPDRDIALFRKRPYPRCLPAKDRFP